MQEPKIYPEENSPEPIKPESAKPEPAAAEIFPNPWESRHENGLLKSFVATVKESLFKPGRFFSGINVEEPYSTSIYFYFCVIAAFFPPFFILGFLASLFSSSNPQAFNNPFASFGSIVIIPIIILVIIIFLCFTALGMFIISFFMHLPIKLFGGKAGHRATFHVLAYSYVVGLWGIIPFLGGLISLIWGGVLQVIALKRVHQMSTLRAVLALSFYPLLFLIMVIIALIAFPNIVQDAKMAQSRIKHAQSKTIKVTGSKIYQPSKGCKIEGIVFSEDKPSVLIQGNPYGIGDSVCGAKILTITQDDVTVQLADTTGTYKIGHRLPIPSETEPTSASK